VLCVKKAVFAAVIDEINAFAADTPGEKLELKLMGTGIREKSGTLTVKLPVQFWACAVEQADTATATVAAPMNSNLRPDLPRRRAD
jgi:hypothetical protein